MKNLYYIIPVSFMLLLIASIVRNQMQMKLRKNKAGVKIGKGIADLVIGIFCLILFLMWSTFLGHTAKEAYSSLGVQYISSIFQLLDLHYLEHLRRYFYEHQMAIELSRILLYQNNLPKMMLWITATGCLAVVSFYRAYQKDILYQDELIFSEKSIKLDKVSGYRWGSYHLKRHFQKDIEYYDLSIFLNYHKLIAKIYRKDSYEIILHVHQNDKEYANYLLRQAKVPEY